MRTVLLPILVLILSSISHISAQNTPPPGRATTTQAAPPLSNIQEYLNAHNKARAEVSVGPLTWSDTIAKSASLAVRYQKDKQNCRFANLTNSKYGGNQVLSSGTTITPLKVVEIWVDEKRYYTYANNSCRAQCGSYTQVVWKKSVELGCAQAKRVKENCVLTICFYNPPGNLVGERPY